MSANMMLHLQTVPARNGLLWIRHAFKVWQRKPLALTGLYSFSFFMVLLCSQLPLIGAPLAAAAMPLLSLGFMLATHLVLQNQTPTVAVFAAPLKLTQQRRQAQLVLCAAYAVCLMLIWGLLTWAYGDTFRATSEALSKEFARETPNAEVINSIMLAPDNLRATGWQLFSVALLSVPFWHAPALVHWGGQGAMQALFSSTLGLWRNRGAFLLNALAWLGLLLALGIVLSLLSLLLGPLILLAFGALMLILPTLFYASLYFTFIDCFMFGAPRDLLSKP
ncbi:hypothetical protein J7U46_14160 [Pelomonas sp. V22]|uniref:BPSS1780 family membrane protein n=1 Tax=Pelomonas sp. V22 TaxID=2822139 RepID=UPI0024A7E85E|nr:BPSS1780 family membrane protein [Pelomonas sp. V22]MDI4634198.1 hypothetical protein [Pelomonas sp. V22]